MASIYKRTWSGQERSPSALSRRLRRAPVFRLVAVMVRPEL
jgi:hypothetical protein